MTPSDYQKGLEEAFQGSTIKTAVKDIFAIPNYMAFLSKHVDGFLSHLHTLEFTQLQWIFEHCEASRLFPYGVKTTYRRYSSDRICEIREQHRDCCTTTIGKAIGLEAYAVPTQTYPAPDTFPQRGVEGFSLLTSLPCTSDTPWEPDPFDVNTVSNFSSLETGIFSFFAVNSPERIEWADWLQNQAPRTNSVDEYLESHVMERPLESYFNLNLEIEASWRSGVSSIDHYEFNGELTEADWAENMNIAYPQPGVHCRFDTNPPDPMQYVNSRSDVLTKFNQASEMFNE